MIKPKALKRGDTIGLVGPSGAIQSPDGAALAEKAVRELGFNVKLGKSCNAKYGYLSGSDQLRADDVNEMFADDAVDAILCTRGGYGTMRILDRFDYDVARRHPKLFIGYSDITAMHTAYAKYSNLVTMHGPMAATCMARRPDPYTIANFLNTVTTTKPLGELQNSPDQPLQCVQPGQAHGRLVGGNLSLISQCLGTPYALDCTGDILFLEDVGEKTYHIDGMFTQLRNAGLFEQCAGVVLGDFTNCEIEYPDFYFTVEELVRDIILPSGKPVLGNLCAGHGPHKLTLPLGVQCELDATNKKLTITEAALV